MILFPAIDLKDGVCVRLEQGDMARATVFNRDPAQQAHAFETQGFRHLHVVDLDGAFAGKPMNVTAVERILETVGLCVQLGGGIRDMQTIDGWLEKGVNRVIIGTAAVRDPALVKEAAKKYPERVAVGLDARDGKVAVEGWAEQSELTVLDIARRFEDAGVAAIIYTDVARDGMLQGHQLGRDDRARRRDLDSGDRVRRPRVDRGHQAHDSSRARASSKAPSRAARSTTAGSMRRRRCALIKRRAEQRPDMFKVRVIPCLDVKDGRVVKGVNFVNLRDAGDPVEAAIAYDAAGADELTFLDITASHENRDTIFDVVTRTAEACFMPLTVGGGVRTVEDIRKLLTCGADKVSINTAAVNRPRLRARKRRRNSATSASWWRSTPRRCRSRASRPLGDLHPWRPQPDRARCGRLCARGRRARRRRNPAHLDGSRRHQAGLRYRAHPRDRRRRARCR